MSTSAERLGARFSMAGRRALVTGGSLSIGRAIVLAFADAGADIAVQYASSSDVTVEHAGAAADLAALLRERGGRHEMFEADFAIEGEGTRAVKAAANPMGRAGTPEDMAGAALLLCSDAGAFITGADLQATGGAHL